MVSNKALATVFFITLNMQCTASSNTQEPVPSSKSAPLTRKRIPALKTREVLQDTNSDMNPVEVPGGSIEVTSTLQELSVPQVDNPFETLVEQGEYGKIFEIGKQMNDEEFLKQLCPFVKTLEQYNGIVKYLRRYLVALFYIHGNIEVVKRAIIKSGVYDKQNYAYGGNLETALALALEKDRHDRFMELLDVRMGITAETDEPVKQEGRETSFECFVYRFLETFALRENGMALRRLLILHGDELKNKYHDILDTLCQKLVLHLSSGLHWPKARELLVDLIGQSSLLMPVIFARGFLYYDINGCRSDFIKYGWREAIQEGLKSEYEHGGKELWRVMQEEKPKQFPGQFPDTEKARIAVCMYFPTKQQKEEEWIKENVPYFWKDVEIIFVSIRFPNVLTKIVIDYAATKPTWIDIEAYKSTSTWKKLMRSVFG